MHTKHKQHGGKYNNAQKRKTEMNSDTKGWFPFIQAFYMTYNWYGYTFIHTKRPVGNVTRILASVFIFQHTKKIKNKMLCEMTVVSHCTVMSIVRNEVWYLCELSNSYSITIKNPSLNLMGTHSSELNFLIRRGRRSAGLML